jgi:hypothetical protein
MLKRFGQHLRIGVASSGVAVVRRSAWRPGPPELVAERRIDPSGHAAVIAALRETLEAIEPRGANVSVVLADELVRMWQVVPPRGCSRMSDLHAAAAMRFQALFGASPAGWKLAADWDAAEPFLAVAAPQALVTAIEQEVAGHHGHVVELQPQFVAALNQWRGQRRAGAWFGMLQSQVLTLALFDAGALAAVRSAPVPAQAGREWLESLVAREALRVGLPRPERLQVCGPAPEQWASLGGQLKFVCGLLDNPEGAELSDLARVACTGSAQ